MRILSLDIGSHSVKAVELDVVFGRIELADYSIEPVLELVSETHAASPDEKPADGSALPPRPMLSRGQIAALHRLVADRKTRYDRLVVNFPKGWVTTRLFRLPTKDRKTIQSSLGFELDDDVPFSLENVIYDFAILNAEDSGSTVFAALALKEDLRSLIADLEELHLDPESITVESWAISYLMKKSLPKEYEGRPVCVVNLGAHQTSIHMLLKDEPVLTHTCACGGANITQAIAQAHNLSFDQAEKAKVDGAFLLTATHLSGHAGGDAPTAEQISFSETIETALLPIVREIKQTLMAFKSEHKISPRAIFIAGGTSLIPNIQLYLEEQLKIPVFQLSYMGRIVGQTLQLSESTEAQITMATALALSVVKVERNHSVNFRKDAFAKLGGLGTIDWASYKKPLKYVAASLVFMYVNLIVQGIILSTRASQQDAQLERAIKAAVGVVSPSVLSNYKNSPTTLKSAVGKELAKYRPTHAAPPKPQISAFDVLNKVSASIPKDMTLDVNLFQIKEGRLRLTGVVDQLTNSARIQKALEETKLLTDVKKDKAEEDLKTRKVKIEFSAKVAEAGNVKGP